MDRNPMTTTITYFPADSTSPRETPAGTVADLQALAEQLLSDYRAVGANRPGIELTRGDPEDGGESVSLAVAEIGWAMVHTNADFDQRRTDDPQAGEGSIDVDWGQITPIPRRWFIPPPVAVGALEQWLIQGTLDTEVFASTDCA